MADRDWHILAERIASNARNVSFRDARRLVEAAGVTMARSGATSHRVFTKRGCYWQITLVEGHDPLSIGVVKKMLMALNECGDDV